MSAGLKKDVAEEFGERHEEGSALAGWPALVFVSIVLGAAVFSFSPRPHPAFPASGVHTDRLLVTGLAAQGSRLLAVGEQGKVLYADSPKGPWHVAKVEPDHGSTLTQVSFIGEKTVVAVGHDSLILRSEDGGENWKVVNFDAEKSEALLGVAGPFDGRVFAFGSFGQLLASDDDGATWQRKSLAGSGGGGAGLDPFAQADIMAAEVAPAAPEPAAPAEPAAPEAAAPVAPVPEPAAPEAAAPAPAAPAVPEAAGDFTDPFAGFTGDAGGGSWSDKHINGMARTVDGSLVIVGERGLMARSRDNGETWSEMPQVYKGSFYGVLNVPPNGLLAYGMRGNAYYSRSNGNSWTKSSIPVAYSMFGGTVMRDGRIVLVGANNAVLVSKDGGANFEMVSEWDRLGLSSVVPIGGNEWLTAGEGGITMEQQLAEGAKP